jgi:hypothetical protein
MEITLNNSKEIFREAELTVADLIRLKNFTFKLRKMKGIRFLSKMGMMLSFCILLAVADRIEANKSGLLIR